MNARAKFSLIFTSVLLLALAACDLAAGQAFTTSPAPEHPAPDATSSHFTAVDIFLDPKGSRLAAYQLEFLADPARVKLVGVEGGENAAFKEPPYYDPAALSHSRIILAALNPAAAGHLPAGRSRVARLHLEITGNASAPRPEFSAKLIVAASPDEKPIPSAAVSVAESEGVDR
jgi:hypothetical protein